jgi:hypothetical protein
MEVSPVHRWLLETPAPALGFAIGPVRLQTPHGRGFPPQFVATDTLPRSMTFASCANPTQPVSSRDVSALASNEIPLGQGLPTVAGVSVTVGDGGFPEDDGVLVIVGGLGVAVALVGVGVRVAPSVVLSLPLLLLSPQWAMATAITA